MAEKEISTEEMLRACMKWAEGDVRGAIGLIDGYLKGEFSSKEMAVTTVNGAVASCERLQQQFNKFLEEAGNDNT